MATSAPTEIQRDASSLDAEATPVVARTLLFHSASYSSGERRWRTAAGAHGGGGGGEFGRMGMGLVRAMWPLRRRQSLVVDAILED